MNHKILIIQLRPGIGDLCMFLPRIHEIAKKYSGSSVTLMTKSRSKASEILRYDPYIKEIFYIDEKNIKKKFKVLFLFFKKNKFNLVFSYQYGPKYLKYIFLAKLFKAKTFYYGVFKKNENMMNKAILSNELWLNIKIDERKSFIHLPKYNKTRSNQVIVGIGASGDNKRWSTKNFTGLVKFLLEMNFEIIISGGPNETHIINEIKKYNNNDLKIISIEKYNIHDSIQIIKNAKYHIGNDSGFMHISACLGMKTFCLYGDTPSEDSAYNELIIPILPEGYERITHGSNLMDKISLENVKEKFLQNL